ncbi:MAG TPA: AIPR family protein [Opitutaceae bacterium]|nr:AIPR family protein [Opitutaceae bacterium]HRJ47934.1 AIPR family protein [Opitutaceae bacterium]
MHKHDTAAKAIVSNNAANAARKVTFSVEDDCLRRVIIKEEGREVRIYHIYPRLWSWKGGQLPEDVNPRSHDETALTSGVAKAIGSTINDSPEDFYLANRGATILADELTYDKDRGVVEITITDSDLHGIADGATSDAVLAKIQKDILAEHGEKAAEVLLNRGRIHLEVIVGLTLKERIDRLVMGRNTSRQVTPWSMSNFRGAFDWISEILEINGGPFAGKIGYEENAGKQMTVLDVLSLLTLFHPDYDAKGQGERNKAPTVAYSSKGRMDARLNNKDLQVGYKALAPILADILRLHDYVYAQFEHAYKKALDGRAKLGRRAGFESKKVQLPLTGMVSNYTVPSGVLFPLLASLRALVRYDQNGKAYWVQKPEAFFDTNGSELVAALIEQLDTVGGNPQTAGKKKPVYTALHDRARLLLIDQQRT